MIFHRLHYCNRKKMDRMRERGGVKGTRRERGEKRRQEGKGKKRWRNSLGKRHRKDEPHVDLGKEHSQKGNQQYKGPKVAISFVIQNSYGFGLVI